eukprot:m.310336 g.310336  ORF g.310336 m.310336 type:complete len:382 (+) comp50980_c0_seq1:16-1161(+)
MVFSRTTFCLGVLLSLGACIVPETVVVFNEGGTVTLNCSTAENEIPLWFRAENMSGRPLSRGSTYKVGPFQGNKASLEIVCANSSLHVYRLFHLQRVSPPKLNPVYSSSKVQEVVISKCSRNRSLSISCGSRIIKAAPTPSYTWYHGRSRIGKKQKEFRLLQHGSELVVRNPGRHLNESFFCVAANYLGRLNITFFIELIPSDFDDDDCVTCPSLPMLTGDSAFDDGGIARESDTVEMALNVSGYLTWMYVLMTKKGSNDSRQCCVSPDMFYNLEGCPYKFKGRQINKCSMSCAFVMENVTESDEGTYQFFAVNPMAPDKLKDFHLIVYSPSVATITNYIAVGGGCLIIVATAILLGFFMRKKGRDGRKAQDSLPFLQPSG